MKIIVSRGVQLAGAFTGAMRTAIMTWRSGAAADHPERGDVPGWVMITLMSAVLVAALLALAGPALEGLFTSAINQVSQK